MTPAAMPRDPRESPPVSVIVPARDAHAALPGALDSILGQDYDGPVEIVVADGSRTERTRDLLRERYPEVRRVGNPEATIPAGLNLALAHCRHAIVARCDARARLPPGYLSRAVATLGRTGAANAGGRPRPVGETGFERAVALAMSSPLGAGDARYRLGGAEGPVDTVYLGVYRRSAIEDVGGWNEDLRANEDYELNWRLRQRGFAVWFDPALVVRYRPRGGFRALARQYFGYGRWKAVMLARHPRSLRARQLAAPLLVAGYAGSAGLLLAAGYAGAAGLLPGTAGGLPAGALPSGYPASLPAWALPSGYPASLPAWALPLGYPAGLLAWALPLGYPAGLLACSAAIARGRAGALRVAAAAATIHWAWGIGFYFGMAAALRRLAGGGRSGGGHGGGGRSGGGRSGGGRSGGQRGGGATPRADAGS